MRWASSDEAVEWTRNRWAFLRRQHLSVEAALTAIQEDKVGLFLVTKVLHEAEGLPYDAIKVMLDARGDWNDF